MFVQLNQNNVLVRPFSDTAFDVNTTNPYFDDVEKLWEELKQNNIEKTDIAKMAFAIIENYAQLNLNPRLGYYPSIFTDGNGIHAGIFLDLDIEHMRKTNESIRFFTPSHVLSVIEQ